MVNCTPKIKNIQENEETIEYEEEKNRENQRSK